MAKLDLSKPVMLYGSNISYFTGKMENYFKIKEIPYERRVLKYPKFEKTMKGKVGIHQMPAVVLPDGRWMTDTTKMIQWFELNLPEKSIIPKDPIQAFFAFLLEDWADEWWWRTAMHYRWHYTEGAHFASRHLAEELLSSIPLPIWMKKIFLMRRQRNGYTTGDGITSKNLKTVEEDFLFLLNNLDKIFKKRKFLFGNRPSIADIGFSGPFFRHFALDPVPLEIIRQKAPNVLNWVSTLWKARLSELTDDFEEGIPNDLEPLFKEIGQVYLPYLSANVQAVKQNNKKFDFEFKNVCLRKARFSFYRVWCLKQLRDRFVRLPEESKTQVESLLKKFDCWEPLWKDENLPLSDNQEEGLPFKADRKMLGVNE